MFRFWIHSCNKQELTTNIHLYLRRNSYEENKKQLYVSLYGDSVPLLSSPFGLSFRKVCADSGGRCWKDSKITLRVSNESLGHILKLVAEKANATLVLQGVSIIGINDTAQLNVKEMPLDKVMAIC